MPTIKKRVHRPWLPKQEVQAGRTHCNTKFYQSSEWRKPRALKLAAQPLCEECLRKELFTNAQMVDHILPINRGGDPLALENLQGLCYRCHNVKSAKEIHLR